MEAELKYCKGCGAAIIDATAHQKWHSKYEALEKRVEEAFLFGAAAIEKLEEMESQ